MYIDIVPNRNAPPAVLLRKSYREGGKVKKRTIANFSKLPIDVIGQLCILLRGAGTPSGVSNRSLRNFGKHIQKNQ